MDHRHLIVGPSSGFGCRLLIERWSDVRSWPRKRNVTAAGSRDTAQQSQVRHSAANSDQSIDRPYPYRQFLAVPPSELLLECFAVLLAELPGPESQIVPAELQVAF